MAEILVRPAEAADVDRLAPRLRAADRVEVMASSGVDGREALRRSLAFSDEAWAGCVDGEVACLFGVAPASLLSDAGVPWLLGSNLIERHATAFLRRNRAMVRRWRSRYAVLENHVDARNAAAIHWLRWLGFAVRPAEPFGLWGLPFHPFEMRFEECVSRPRS